MKNQHTIIVTTNHTTAMKNLHKWVICLAAALAMPLTCGARGHYLLKYFPVSDTELEWTQFDEKDGKAIIDKEVLKLESKHKEKFTVSCADFQLRPQDEDFIADFIFKPENVNDDNPFGIVFDFKNDRNYSLITFGKKNYTLYTCEKGELAVAKRGIYKLISRGKEDIRFSKNLTDDSTPDSTDDYASMLSSLLKDKKVWEVTLMKERGFLVIFINGIEIARFSNLTLTNPGMGFYAGPKTKLEAYGVRYSPISYDNEEESE